MIPYKKVKEDLSRVSGARHNAKSVSMRAQAGLPHAISPISMKPSQYKGSTPKLKKTH